MKVIIKLMAKGPKAESRPSARDTSIDRNMKSALTSNASPTFLDITFTFIQALCLNPSHAHPGIPSSFLD